jgi:hypothetical protein
MQIKFKVSKEDYKTIKKIFKNYIKQRYYPTSNCEFYKGDFGANGRITEDCITINLCTGNYWQCYEDNGEYFVYYEGSRAGLRALTPFTFHKKFINAWVDENDLNIIIRKSKEETKTLTLTVVGFKTSFSSLKWHQRLERLAEEPEKAIILTWDNIPLRVFEYKNVYKDEEK